MLSAIGVAAMTPPDSYIVSERRAETRSHAVPIIKSDVTLAVIELQQLALCLREYEKVGGSQIVIGLYRSRYTIIIAWMYIVELLSSDIVEQYFNPKGYLEASRAAHEKQSAS
jgi:hypothetical protein